MSKLLAVAVVAVALIAATASPAAAQNIASPAATAASSRTEAVAHVLRLICFWQGGRPEGPFPMQCSVGLSIGPGENALARPDFVLIATLCRFIGFSGVAFGGKGLPNGGFGIGAWWCA